MLHRQIPESHFWGIRKGTNEMKAKKWSIMLLAMLLIIAVLAACAPATSPAGETAAPAVEEAAPVVEEAAPAVEEAAPAAEEAAPAEETAPAEEPAPAEEAGGMVYGGILPATMGSGGPHQIDFNPYSPNRTSMARGMIYEPLLIFDTAVGVEPIYWLATGYEFSDDLTSITYNLREGVKWNDGEDFDADDVVFSFEIIQQFPALDRYSVLPYLDSVEKVDQYTVKMNMSKPFALADSIFGAVNIVPEHVWSTIEDPALYNNEESPVGTGPFTQVSKATPEVIELCKNPNYWQEGKPYMDCIRFASFSSGDAVDLALINGELHWANSFIPDVENTYVAASEYNNIADWNNGLPVILYMNHERAPMNDVAFRQAVSQAINYQNILDIVYFGKSNPPGVTGIQPSLADVWQTEETAALAAEMGLGVYDPAAAAATLDAAGYVDVDGDGIRELPDGSPMVIKATVVGSFTDFVSVLQLASQDLLSVGVKMEIAGGDMGQVVGAMSTGDFDVAMWFGTLTRSPWDTYRNQLDSRLVVDGRASGDAFARWSDPTTDALLDEFVTTLDFDKQYEIMGELQKIYTENVINVPLFTRFTTYQYNTSIFEGFPTNENYFASGAPAGDPMRLRVLTELHCKNAEVCN
jgi:peptide/nickel transport system substrate-binding protein